MLQIMAIQNCHMQHKIYIYIYTIKLYGHDKRYTKDWLSYQSHPKTSSIPDLSHNNLNMRLLDPHPNPRYLQQQYHLSDRGIATFAQAKIWVHKLNEIKITKFSQWANFSLSTWVYNNNLPLVLHSFRNNL
jgi:hypothetical protein